MVTGADPAPARRVRLLYVEDDRVHALLFEAAIAVLPSVEMRVAESGGEALSMVAGWQPDVLVLDGHLPDTTGAALLRHLRSSCPALANTPAFLCSADDAPPDTAGAADRGGFAGSWKKPVDAAAVAAGLAAAWGAASAAASAPAPAVAAARRPA